jgi:hypothetical protein
VYDTLFAEPIEEYGISRRTEMRNQPDFAFEKIKYLTQLSTWFNQVVFDVKQSNIPMSEVEMARSSDEFNSAIQKGTRNLLLMANLNRMIHARRKGNMELVQHLKEETRKGLISLFEEKADKDHIGASAEEEIEFDELFKMASGFEITKFGESKPEPHEDEKCKSELDTALTQAKEMEIKFNQLKALISSSLGDEVTSQVIDKIGRVSDSELSTLMAEGVKKKFQQDLDQFGPDEMRGGTGRKSPRSPKKSQGKIKDESGEEVAPRTGGKLSRSSQVNPQAPEQ